METQWNDNQRDEEAVDGGQNKPIAKPNCKSGYYAGTVHDAGSQFVAVHVVDSVDVGFEFVYQRVAVVLLVEYCLLR